MKRLTFYKPNSKNTGSAFSANFKGQELYINITKQFSWSESDRRASFRENLKNPQKSLSVKMNTVEAASMIYSIRNKIKYTSYHKSKNQKLSIFFEAYIDKATNLEKGFAFKVLKEDAGNSVDKINFSVGFSFSELVVLELFFEEYIKDSFAIASATSDSDPVSEASETPKRDPMPREEAPRLVQGASTPASSAAKVAASDDDDW